MDHYLIILSRFDFSWICRPGAFMDSFNIGFVDVIFYIRVDITRCIFAWFKTWTRTDFSTWRVLLTITTRYTIAVYVTGPNTGYRIIYGWLNFTSSKSLSLNTLNNGYIRLKYFAIIISFVLYIRLGHEWNNHYQCCFSWKIPIRHHLIDQ